MWSQRSPPAKRGKTVQKARPQRTPSLSRRSRIPTLQEAAGRRRVRQVHNLRVQASLTSLSHKKYPKNTCCSLGAGRSTGHRQVAKNTLNRIRPASSREAARATSAGQSAAVAPLRPRPVSVSLMHDMRSPVHSAAAATASRSQPETPDESSCAASNRRGVQPRQRAAHHCQHAVPAPRSRAPHQQVSAGRT